MLNIFEGLPYVKIFLDDILIHSNNRNDHESHVKHVLLKLKEIGASINFDKSCFFKTEVKYLGSIINEHGIKIDKSRVNASENYLNITTRK